MSDNTAKQEAEAAAPVAEVAPVTEAAPVAEVDKMETDAAVEVKAEEKTAEKTESAQEEQNGAAKTEKPTEQNGQSEHKKNRKFDPSTLPVTDDPAAIRSQVEFYFGDSNLPTDKFMWENTGGEENKPIPLKTICSFKRMHRFQPYSAVVAALKESQALEVTGEEGAEQIKRKVAYRSIPEGQKVRVAKSVYIKGFGQEDSNTQFQIEGWLSKFGAVDRVKLRREHPSQEFKGSVFVEFHEESEAKAFVALSPAPTWNGNDLKIMMKADYLAEKTRQIRDGEIEPSKARPPNFFEGKDRSRGGNRGGRGRGFHNGPKDKDDWNKRRDGEQKNGFRGGRGGRGRGRGARGRGGRGGRDRDRNNNNNNNNDREAPKEAPKEAAPKSINNVKVPTIQATNEKGEVNGKRSREDDGGEGPPAKKVDVKA